MAGEVRGPTNPRSSDKETLVGTAGQEEWPSGLKVMVVDSNAHFLFCMEQLLLQCNYKVTTCSRVQEAIAFVMDNQQSIDLIISDVFLPSEEGLLILKTIVFQLDIPVVMMSWSGETSMVMKHIAYGACDFLIKPVRLEELRNIWQHVFRKQLGNQMKNEFRTGSNISTSTSLGKRRGNLLSSMQDRDEVVTDIRDLKKARLHWTKQLHHQFVTAINTIGIDKAVPKKILEIMKVQHLTREQVSSHLQKYKTHLRNSSSDEPKVDVGSSNNHASESHGSVPDNTESHLISLNQIKGMIREYHYHKGEPSCSSQCTIEDQNILHNLHGIDGIATQQAFDPTSAWNFPQE